VDQGNFVGYVAFRNQCQERLERDQRELSEWRSDKAKYGPVSASFEESIETLAAAIRGMDRRIAEHRLLEDLGRDVIKPDSGN